jgi:glyoxylase-like metal-dependent hydrolase (beta-lactamase superfamily II)
MRLGEIEVHPLKAGAFRLDGGAMFGVIPKVLWEKQMAPDERNRIGMAMNVLLVKASGKNILVDTGAGDKEDAKFRDIYGLGPSTLNEELMKHGLVPDEIDVVINTHLHFDHAGGNTVRDSGGRLLPAFPNARYLVQRAEFDDAMAANERNKASYFPGNYAPLYDDGRMELVDGETEIAPGVAVEPLPGHTRGLQGLMIRSHGDTGLYLADCVPTSHHIPLPWIMAYDLYPTETLATKKKILPKAAREGWLLFFEHDPEVLAATIEETGKGKFALRPAPKETI